MAHARLLSAQVGYVLGVGHGLKWHALDDLEPEPFEAAVLRGVVGQKPHGGDAEIDEDLGADAVLAAVDGEAELEVGVDSVEAPLLQAVGPQLVTDADSPALVPAQVHDHTEPDAV